MKKSTRILLTLCVLLVGLGLAGQASAQTRIFDWPSAQMPVVVQNETGLIFISAEKEPWRAYSWAQKNAGEGFEPVYMVDLSGDGTPEVVGAGKPSFVLKADSDPMWLLREGCQQLLIADFVADAKPDLVCNGGKELKAYTYDGQFAWGVDLGKPVEFCRAGDLNADNKADLECKLRGSKSWVQIDGTNGSILEDSTSSAKLSEDGNHGLNLKAPATASSTKKLASSAPLSETKLDGEVLAALKKDLNNDGKEELVAVTKNSIYIVSADGKDVKKFAASTKKYKRQPLAKLEAIYANQLEDNDAAVESVRAAQDNLSKCYASRVRANQFAGTGLLILKVGVDHDAKVTGVETVHSEVKDKDIEQCAKNALKGVKFSKAESEDAAGSVNVNIQYTFRDE